MHQGKIISNVTINYFLLAIIMNLFATNYTYVNVINDVFCVEFQLVSNVWWEETD